jgi:uncharacterized membrane protein YoaK (UPF0700 family)
MSEPDRPPQPLVVSLAVLTVVSGMVDAVSFLGLGHVFTANMTGNVVLVAFGLAGAPGFSVAASACALGFFVVGAIAGGRIALWVRPHRSMMMWVVTLEAALTAVAATIAGTVAVLGAGWPRYTVIALLAFAMGIRNAAVQRLGASDMTTTVLTSTLTRLASDSSLAGGTNNKASFRAASVLCMFTGALVGAVLVVHLQPGWALGIASVLLVATATYFSREAPHELGVAP